MLAVTDAACAHVAKMLSEAEIPEEKDLVVRVIFQPDGLALTLDETRAEDATFDHDGSTVLAVEDQLSQALAGKTLDVQATEEGDTLTIR